MEKKQQQPSIKSIASALNVTPQAIKQRAIRESWKFTEEKTRGGRRRLYEVPDLPADVQAALAAQLLAAAPAAPSAPADASNDAQDNNLAAGFERQPQSSRREAGARLAIVQQFVQLIARGFSRTSSIEAVTGEHAVSAATLTRYLAIVKGQPEHLWLYLLAPRHAGRTATAELSAEAWEILKADYLRLERPAAAACIDRLRGIARDQDKDWTIPANRTLLRRLKAIPRAVQTLARQGSNALRDLYPAQQRSKAALHALAIINGDGYKHNLWVRFPDGEIARAKTWYWQDVYSSKVLSWRVDKTEHTDMIRLAFGDLVEQFGIPNMALMDNTLAAANKTMSGGVKHRFRFKVREEEPDGVFLNLGCVPRFAEPRHGQSKPVERAFGVGGIGEYIDKAPEAAGCWTGANPLDKPDYNGKTRAIELVELQAVIVREIAAYNARDGRRGANVYGRSFDAVFEESYKVTPIRRATEAQRRLWLLATEPIRASGKGEITLNAGRIVGERLANRYWSPELVDYAGKMLCARFDPQRLHEGAHIYTADGRYICFAACDKPEAFNDQVAARERARSRNIWMRNQKAMRVAEQRMDVLDVVKARAGDGGSIPAPAAPARTVIQGEFRRPLETPKAAPLSDADEARLETITRELTGSGARRLQVPNDPNVRYAWHYKLAAAVKRGVAVPAELQDFVAGYGKSDECRRVGELFAEFKMDIEEYASDLVLEEPDVQTHGGPRRAVA